MKLVVGLGNPGPKYQITRHNIGFLTIDSIIEVFEGKRQFKTEFRSETQKIKIGSEQVILCKPQTFMNLSGEAVQPLLQFYKIELPDLLVIHDEVDQPFGAMKFQFGRGHGGHNGVKNIHQCLATADYARLRLGVGRPPVFVNDEGEKTRSTMDVATWVLNNFSSSEMENLPEFMENAIQGIEIWIDRGVDAAATKCNGIETTE